MQGKERSKLASNAIIREGFDRSQKINASVIDERDNVSSVNSVKLFYGTNTKPRTRLNQQSVTGMDQNQIVFRKSDHFKAKLQKIKQDLALRQKKDKFEEQSPKGKRKNLEPIEINTFSLSKVRESFIRPQNQQSRPRIQEQDEQDIEKSQKSDMWLTYSETQYRTKQPSCKNIIITAQPVQEQQIIKEKIATPFKSQVRNKIRYESPAKIDAICVGCGNFINEDHPINRSRSRSRSISKEKKKRFQQSPYSPQHTKGKSLDQNKVLRLKNEAEQSKILNSTKTTLFDDEDIVINENDKLKTLIQAFKKTKNERSNKELEMICKYLREIESFKRFCTEALLQIIDLIQINKVNKGSMFEFDFANYVILLKGQVFVMTHDRLNKNIQSQITKPIELPLDALLDPGNKDGIYLKMHYYGEDTLELKFDKEMFRRALAVEFLQVRKFPIFKHFNDTQFKNLYSKTQIHLIDQPCKTVYNIGDKADSIFIVRQGVLHEQHEVPPKMKQLCHCRFYRPGQWFGISEFMVQGNQRMSRVQNQVFEPKDGKVFYESNGANLIPTLIPLTENADPQNLNDYITINEYMIRQMDQNRTIAEFKQRNQCKIDEKLCRQCTMTEFREIESDLTILIEISYNDILEQILENDPNLNTEVKKLCVIVQNLRESIPDLVWMPIKKLANRSDTFDAKDQDNYSDLSPSNENNRTSQKKGPEIEFVWAKMQQAYPRDPICIVEHQRIEKQLKDEQERKLRLLKQRN